MSAPSFAAIYDLRGDPAARELVRRHRAYWGRSWTSHHVLDADTVVLVFRSAGPRWAAWEAVRRAWIEGAA
jgi:hypothetical protein